MLKKLIIDTEKENNVTAYYYRPKEEMEVVLAGKIIIPVPKNEQNSKIYKLLEEHCNVIFCTTQVLDAFKFYPIPRFAIFAVDSKENCFGTIDGIGDLIDDDYPVGYVNNSSGICSKLTNSLKEFLELVIFYPFWQEIIRCNQNRLPYDIKVMEQEYIKNNPQAILRQCEISSILHFTKNPNAIQALIANIDCKPELVVYSSKDEAQKENSFLDISNSYFC